MHWDSYSHRSVDFVTNVLKPPCSTVILSAGFGKQHRPPVAVPDILQNLTKMPVPGIRMVDPGRIVDPLVALVEVDPDHVEVLRPAPEFRSQTSAQHVPGLKLGEGICGGLFDIAWYIRIADNVNCRLWCNQTNTRHLIQQYVTGGNCRTDEIVFQLVAPINGMRRNGGSVAAGPRNKGNFINRCQRNASKTFTFQIASTACREIRKLFWKRRREYIDVIRPAEMKQIKDQFDVCSTRSLDIRID